MVRISIAIAIAGSEVTAPHHALPCRPVYACTRLVRTLCSTGTCTHVHVHVSGRSRVLPYGTTRTAPDELKSSRRQDGALGERALFTRQTTLPSWHVNKTRRALKPTQVPVSNACRCLCTLTAGFEFSTTLCNTSRRSEYGYTK